MLHDDEYRLGQDPELIQLDRITAIREMSAIMAGQAQRELLMFGRTIESSLYDHPAFIDAVRSLALSRPVQSIRILVYDTRDATQSGQRLIELARHLSSRIAIRRVADEDQDRLDGFLVADERGYVRRRLAETMEAVANFNDPLEARQLKSVHMQIWERSTPDAELRRLYL